ncbi:type II toxin-antitoxin system PemK/MazF family toxin [Bacillus sp. S0628]|uniref:type II toxin-antitoxin system PemK/MazF family toxin n=1 Tax=Bacillus sp. S0628 TaxID=2957802 RepID=UPI0020A0C80D|nr:type II toxin-antitoxin system PemK/MazF family toxin [Bacillus sp. S0628]MCP1324289.1 type II toxin-antitoxin system PemK/MazF family toxin [Bacillus sp. S0628]
MTESTERVVEQGEIWVQKVRHNGDFKYRPFLIANIKIERENDVIALPVSSNKSMPRNQYDVKVKHEDGTGLLRFPSYIRVSKPLTINKYKLGYKIGKLDDIDLANALEKLRSLF